MRMSDVAALNNLPKQPQYVRSPYDYLARSREDVIETVLKWIEESNELVFWLHGAAGLGKSTVAHQLVEILQDNGRLATILFPATNQTQDRGPSTVIQMMARDLGGIHSRAIPSIAQ